MRILLFGHSGQVGRELQRALRGHELICPERSTFDLARPDSLRPLIVRERPDLLINAAAYTAVDRAEQEAQLAFAINAEAPAVMAAACAELGIALIHYSTDYVFDGHKPAPYLESDTPNPLNIYGASKLAGERAIASSGCEHLILRTSWVYARHGHNFLLTMQRLLQEREQVRVVDDQIGAPTWAGSIAQASTELITAWQQGNRRSGLYHLTCHGETSWFGFARAIGERLRAAGRPCAEILPIPSSDYPTPARRPLNSRLDGRCLAHDWNLRLPHWEEALDACLG
ncbi:dTDP-4-dehydrorhamnose reductase [Pseudomonas sp. NCCP-436]|uniref:dTDP-4-dehydrorhamnose reductase n=1 Tax=Pseudomonas sp. NCCP-436 TaxID=2842481 RepID=UPI001C7EC5E3|nr:dTDP-4-dehydrorhamnose reductase [Pseudomonas sp. NCCP-436]GIZ12456.1 NAD(P)-dependent oxidoreductase [Pseudomonas sp. NCCP-436]